MEPIPPAAVEPIPPLTVEPIPPVDAVVAVAPSRRFSTSFVVLLVAAGVGIAGLRMLSAGGSSSLASAGTNAPAAARPLRLETAKRAAAGTQKWSSSNSAYWVGNRRKSVAFELPAENTVAVWMRSVRPALVVRCMNRRPEVFVVTESALKIEPQSEDHTVTFAFDDQPDVSERWPDSEEHDALFAPDGAAFVSRVAASRTLRFGYTPHNAAPVVAQFSVSGLSAHLTPAARECGGTK